MEIIDGNKVSCLLKEEIKKEIIQFKEENIVPGLSVILVGDHAPSRFYVNKKRKTCEELGIYSEVYEFPGKISQKELTRLILRLNEKESIHGILVQLPLPNHINQYEIMDIVHPSKDVDGFNSYNVAKLYRGEDCLEPCTPKGILTLLDHYKISLEGKRVTIIGRSDIVGKPLSIMLSNKKRNATVTLCHSKTKNLEDITRESDILISAIGKPNYIVKNMIKEGAVVIDVGINKIDDLDATSGKRIVGDVDFEQVYDKTSYITPVPGGVGPMTIVSLIQNTLKAVRLNKTHS